jgi:hypothetical protein
MAFDVSIPSALKSNGMATLSELVDAVAHVEGLDPSTVGLIARNLREAGHIVTGGRGLSAAKMGIRDAANLIIAVNVSTAIQDAAAQVTKYRNLIGTGYPWTTDACGTFGDALELLIESARQRELPSRFLLRKVVGDLSKAFAAGNAEITLTFETPRPVVYLGIGPKGTGDEAKGLAGWGLALFKIVPEILLFQFAERPARGSPVLLIDRQEQTTIGSRTIYAVARVLRLNRAQTK